MPFFRYFWSHRGLFWSLCVLAIPPVGSSAFSWFCVSRRASFRLLVAGGTVSSLAVFLCAAFISVLVSIQASECSSLDVKAPRLASYLGVTLILCAHFVQIFLATRIYTAMKLAEPHADNANDTGEFISEDH